MLIMTVRGPLRRASSSTPRQLCNGASYPVLIENTGVTAERVATHFGVTAFFSVRPVSLASPQHCRSVDADTNRKRALKWKNKTSL